MLIAGLALASAIALGSAHGECFSDSTWTGLCSATNSGSQVDVSASATEPGRPGTTSPSTGGAAPSVPAPPAEECFRCDIVYEVVSFPEVTTSDLASFRPASPTLTGEPAGLGVVGMPANVVATASEHRLSGSLLGYDVVVRFAPAAYVFDFGDGTTLRSSSGGATWQRLGQAPFTPTSTSHVYADRGTYPVRVTVQYAAWVDFGVGTWFPVQGLVSSSAGGYDVRVVEVRTALVDRTCLEGPAGPGC